MGGHKLGQAVAWKCGGVQKRLRCRMQSKEERHEGWRKAEQENLYELRKELALDLETAVQATMELKERTGKLSLVEENNQNGKRQMEQ